MRLETALLSVTLLSLPTTACSKKSEEHLAPTASALSSAAPVPTSTKMQLDTANSGISFTMDAELEKISGRAPASAMGDLYVDLKDITKSTGLVKLDLDKLSIYKQNRDDPGAEFGDEEKNEKQNKDMRMWFQISDDAPAAQREKFRWVEFKIDKVAAQKKDVTALSGSERKLDAKITGDFLLHGRKTTKTIEAEFTFAFDGDSVKSLNIKSKKPFDVSLEEHDVRPRKAFDTLADATLDALGAKVSKIAKVEIDATAVVK